MIKKTRWYTSYDFVAVDNNNPCIIVMAGLCMASDLPKIVNDMDSINCRVMIIGVNKVPHKVFCIRDYSK